MRRESHVRFCEGPGVQFPRATRLVIVFSDEGDARRVQDVLAKRFAKYGLRLHPEKTRLVPFKRPGNGGKAEEALGTAASFELLGFTHFWGRSLKGNWVVMRKTAKDRLRLAVARISNWCRDSRHLPLRQQHIKLTQKLRGHDAYYGITGNYRALQRLRSMVMRAWHKWLSRRSHAGRRNWRWMNEVVLKHFPLPAARIVHSSVK